MLNNCSGGKTPWGTWLTCEENFNQYFANNSKVADAEIKAVHTRYGLTGGASATAWEKYYDRFDLALDRTRRSALAGLSKSTPTTRTSSLANTQLWAA